MFVLRNTPELEVLPPVKATLDSPSSLTLRSSIVGVCSVAKFGFGSKVSLTVLLYKILCSARCSVCTMQGTSEGFGTLEARQGCQVQGGHGKGDSRARDDEPDDDMRGDVSLSF